MLGKTIISGLSMKVLVNFSPLKAGGGQNVAINFLIGLRNVDVGDTELVFLVASGSDVERYLENAADFTYYKAPRNPVFRILFERFLFGQVMKKEGVDLIYTYFGLGWFPKKYRQVSGSADSNLYYPEIDFWEKDKGFRRLRRWLVDRYRIFGLRYCHTIVFENEALERKGRKLFGLNNTRYIRPSIAKEVAHQPYTLPPGLSREHPVGLFLCGWHYNKNIMSIPRLAALFKERGKPFQFLLTAPLDGSAMHNEFQDLVCRLGVEDMVFVVGPVAKECLASLYSQSSFVFLLSKLESFSNNIIEAWMFGVPLVISDEEWSREICGDAAIYVDRLSAEQIVDTICQFDSSPEKIRDLLENAERRLTEYPSIESRVDAELEMLRSVYQGN